MSIVIHTVGLIVLSEETGTEEQNKIANEQLHKWALAVPDTLPMCAMDGAREETDYVFIYLKDLNNKEEKEEFAKECSELYGCHGVYFWDKKQ